MWFLIEEIELESGRRILPFVSVQLSAEEREQIPRVLSRVSYRDWLEGQSSAARKEISESLGCEPTVNAIFEASAENKIDIADQEE